MNFKKPIAMLLGAVLLISTFTACMTPIDIQDEQANSESNQDFPVIVKEVTINSRPDQVAVLSDSLADVVIALGYEGSLIVASEECTQPELQNLQKVSKDDVYAVIELGADLVIGRDIESTQLSAYADAGIPAINIDSATSRTDYERLFSEVGSAMYGATTGYTEGVKTAQSIYTSLDDLSRIIPDKDIITTAVMITSIDEMTAVTGSMITDDCFTYAGVTNVFKEAADTIITKEQLELNNPDIIFCEREKKEQLLSDPNFSSLNAVANGMVFEIPLSYMTWEGRTLVTCATYVAGVAYPELLEESTPSTELPEEVLDPLNSIAEEEEEDTESSQVQHDDGEAVASQESENSEVSGTESEVTTDTSSETSTAEGEAAYTVLKSGDEGDAVLALQTRLSELGYLTAEYGGTYGTLTEDAVRAFQAVAGLETSGVADEVTQEALYKADAPSADVIVG